MGPDSADLLDLQAEHHVKFVTNGVLVDGKTVLTPEQVGQMFSVTPNPVVKIVPGIVIRNGKVLDEPFIAEDPDYDLKIFNGEPLKDLEPYSEIGPDQFKLGGQIIDKATYDQDNLSPTGAIPAGHYFMMGDNRNDSADSTEWGPLAEDRVIGRAQFIFWPLNRAGIIH
jgi:signal peptidase I